MKKIWLHLVRLYLKIGLWFYFKRIRIINKQHMKIKGPALILCNHQNALLDPLLIASNLDEFGYFLARAGVFKKPLVAKLLSTFNMLPVYRIRDGWNNLTNNNAIFDKVVEVLQQEKKVTIFPEGSHNLVRRVRPLSKGFTRIILSSLEKDESLPLKLITVGVNYHDALTSGDSASVYVGKPIDARSLVSENSAESVVNSKRTVFDSITKLTTHIPEESYETILKRLTQLNVDFTEPEAVNACIQSNFSTCERRVQSSFLKLIRKLLKTIYCLSIFPVYAFWKWFVQPKVKELEFTSTFRFAVSIVLIPLFLLIGSLLLFSFFGLTISMVYLAGMLLLTLLTSKL